ncbi:MAG: hypothetical protein JWO69_1342 [Thermoleophilia bacterium]|nr:hypothetical protein [Thermoleophilia bacterium]
MTVDITVQNQTRRAHDVRASAGDIAPRTNGAGGQPVVADAPGTRPRGAGDWLELTPTSWRLAAGKEQRVRVRVRVPDDAPLGGNFATVTFQIDAVGNDAGTVPVTAEVGTTLLFTVAGDYRRSLEASLAADDTWRWGGGRTTWLLELRNEGDLHETVSGSVEVDGMLAAPARVPIAAGIILPGETRTQVVQVELREAPDWLSAEARVELEAGADVAADADRVVVMPWWLLVAGAAVVGVVAWRLRTRRRPDWEH